MKSFNPGKTDPVYIEIGQSTLRILQAEDGLELPLERLPNGRVSSACKQSVSLSLQSFFKRQAWRPSIKAFCAISARGVSLRRITLPTTSKENIQKLLLLQIESEFPLSPDELAWGQLQLNSGRPGGNGSSGQLEYLIAAMKKDTIEEYTELLAGCGVSPVFTVAALARQDLCPPTIRPQALLDIGRNHSELTSFENGLPKSVRVLSWGGEVITRAIEETLGLTRPEAEELKIKFANEQISQPEVVQKVQEAIQQTLNALAKAINGQTLGEKLYLTGQSVRLKDLAPGLTRRLALGVTCEGIEPVPGAGRSAAILGLRTATQQTYGRSPLIIRGKQVNGGARAVRATPWKLCVLAVGLACGVLVVPYLEAVILKPFLARKLTALKEGRRKLALIDAEWGFFQHLKQTAPPYLDALYLLAKAAPPGARIDSLSMN